MVPKVSPRLGLFDLEDEDTVDGERNLDMIRHARVGMCFKT